MRLIGGIFDKKSAIIIDNIGIPACGIRVIFNSAIQLVGSLQTQHF
jgi:hypothetical protein